MNYLCITGILCNFTLFLQYPKAIMKNKLLISLFLIAATGAFWLSSRASQGTETSTPSWLETDSSAAIHSRLLYDFPWTVDEARAHIRERHPDLTDAQIDSFVAKGYIETKVIDGERRVHRKAPRNLGLLNPEMSGTTGRGDEARAERISYVDSVLAYYDGTNPKGLAHRVVYRFSIDVPYHEALEGDTIRVWLPLPLTDPTVEYQSDVEITDASHSYLRADALVSSGAPTHNSVYMSAPAAGPGDTLHFEYTGAFTAKGQWMSDEEMRARLQPYDTESEIYKEYTKFEAPHIVRLDSLAHAIVGDETDPINQSRMVFDYIQDNYPWAGAREYSTISCIPEYVVREGHGDCGQVSLLYISLMRTLGVPARWISGWMLHPGEVNYHDWAGVYYEGIGWLPVDVSFGRYLNARDPRVHHFYNHGIDSHRMCINTGVCGSFIPAKKFVRSETVDFQPGEVESTRGNLFYPGWDHDLEIISITPIEQ